MDKEEGTQATELEIRQNQPGTQDQQSSALAVTEPTHALVALSPTEMASAKAGIQTFLRSKLYELARERAEAEANLESARRHKWKSSSFQSQVFRLKRKELYYGKLLAASESGYAIVPNMEMQVFVVRVARDKPVESAMASDSRWKPTARIQDEEEERLPIGEGRYENPEQRVKNSRWETKDEKGTVTQHHMQKAVEFAEIEFPLAVAHPLVMEATAAAMQMKIFDRIGVVTDSRMTTRGKDPIVLGQIRLKEGYGYRTASFLIAWYLDPKTL